MSKKIVSYKTVNQPNPSAIDDEVNNLLDKGWEPYGAQYSNPNCCGTCFCQVMVKYEENWEGYK